MAGQLSHNAFKITPGGTITAIIDGNYLYHPYGIAVDGFSNVYVTAIGSHNAFKITPNGIITEIIDSTGDGAGSSLQYPFRGRRGRGRQCVRCGSNQ